MPSEKDGPEYTLAELKTRLAELEAACLPIVKHWRKTKVMMRNRAPAELQIEGEDLERLDTVMAYWRLQPPPSGGG